MCQCEDRPCCGCAVDVYESAPVERDEDACSICGEDFTDEDDEDDSVAGFHAGCAEDFGN